MAKAITIRNVSDKVRNELAARAARKGQSLQEYLHAELTALASRMDMDEWLARVRENKERTGSRLSVAKILKYRDRDRR